MAKAAPETIILKGDPIMKELEAAGAIPPGGLVSRDGSGTLVVHAVAGGVAAPSFAKENDIAGDDLEHAYASGEKVLFFTARQGDEVFAILNDGDNASVGDFLESNGAIGELRTLEGDSSVATVAVGSVICVALQDLDLSATGFALAARRIKVEIV